MQRFCHNCGDPIEEGEIFCDNCGTKIIPDENEQEDYKTSNNSQYINTNSEHSSSRNNFQYQQIPHNQVKKPSGFYKGLRNFTTITSVLTVIIVILIIIGSFMDDPTTPPVATSTPNATIAPTIKPTASVTPTPAVTANNSYNTNNALVTWTANLNAYSNYSEAEKKIYVDYSVSLKNSGSGNASNIKVYLYPTANDENAAYIGVKEKTIVNLDENISQITAGSVRDVKTKFYYGNVEASTVTQQYLQDIASRYVKIPIFVEWQENGKNYTQSLVITK